MRRDDGSPPALSQPLVDGLPHPTAPGVPSQVVHLFGPAGAVPQGFIAASTLSAMSSSSSSSIFPQQPQPLPLMAQPPQFYFGPTPGAMARHQQPVAAPLQQATQLYQRIQMQIAVQPPSKTVYQRILKPFPSVYLILPPLQTNVGGDPLSLLYEALSAKNHEEGVFVEASVVRNDNGDPLERSIDGQATAKLERSGWNSGVYTATFKKLKLLTTSQQRSGSKFSLCFRLKCSSLALGSLADMVVISNPIEVFSHSQYLGKSDGDDKAKTQPGAIKYADNPAGLHLKLMESIHAFKELGGAQETLINYISAIYNQNNPIPSAMVALPPSGPVQVQLQQQTEGFPYQHIQPILSNIGEGTPGVSPQQPIVLPQHPTFPLTPTPRRSSAPSSLTSSPPSSPPVAHTPVSHEMTVPPHPRPSPALFPSGLTAAPAPASIPLTPQTSSSLLPSIASLLASSGVDLHSFNSAAQPTPSSLPASRRASIDHPAQPVLSSLLLAPLQALSEACRDETQTSKRKELERRQSLRSTEEEARAEKRERRAKRRRKSAD